MPGQQQGHDLVSKLSACQAATFFIPRLKQNREQIVSCRFIGSPLVDDPRHNFLKSSHGQSVADIQGRGEITDERHQDSSPGIELHDWLNGLADLLNQFAHLHSQQCLGDNSEREPHQIFLNIPYFAVTPAFQHSFSVCHHDGAERSKAIPVKGGLAQSALAQPEISLARQQPVSKQSSIHLQAASLDEIAAVCDQNRFDSVRGVQKINTRREGAVIKNVAILPCPLGKEL